MKPIKRWYKRWKGRFKGQEKEIIKVKDGILEFDGPSNDKQYKPIDKILSPVDPFKGQVKYKKVKK